MSEREDFAKLFEGMAHDAGSSLPGTDSTTESSRTWTPEEEAEMTRLQIQDGRAANATGEITPAHSSRLSDEQQKFLVRMRRARSQQYMLSMEDCDLLLRIVEDLSR